MQREEIKFLPGHLANNVQFKNDMVKILMFVKRHFGRCRGQASFMMTYTVFEALGHLNNVHCSMNFHFRTRQSWLTVFMHYVGKKVILYMLVEVQHQSVRVNRPD